MEDADVQRVKACIELVPLCWGLDRKKRPTIERVLDTLNYTDISVQKEQVRTYVRPAVLRPILRHMQKEKKKRFSFLFVFFTYACMHAKRMNI